MGEILLLRSQIPSERIRANQKPALEVHCKGPPSKYFLGRLQSHTKAESGALVGL